MDWFLYDRSLRHKRVFYLDTSSATYLILGFRNLRVVFNFWIRLPKQNIINSEKNKQHLILHIYNQKHKYNK